MTGIVRKLVYDRNSKETRKWIIGYGWNEEGYQWHNNKHFIPASLRNPAGVLSGANLHTRWFWAARQSTLGLYQGLIGLGASGVILLWVIYCGNLIW